MSERKVLNKYYPPDFDPSKIPRAKCPKNRQFTVRLMAPCNMKCLTCGEYIAKAKKFNARKEDVENLLYLGIRIYRFYIKCPGCLSEISFRTDPESTDYVIEAGAHRNFQALKLAEEQAAREEREAKEEIESNPMLLLENRTQQSQHEMEVLESLEDLRELNERHAGVDLNSMTQKFEEHRKITKEQEKEMEKLAALKALGYEEIEGKLIKRVNTDNLEYSPCKKLRSDIFSPGSSSTDVLVENSVKKNQSLKSKLSGLVKITKKIEAPQAEITNYSEKNLKLQSSITSSGSEGNAAKPSSVNGTNDATKNTFSGNNSSKNNTSGIDASRNTLSGLSLLGNYSDSGSNSDSDE